jgi:aspartate carbamoyltransferase
MVQPEAQSNPFFNKDFITVDGLHRPDAEYLFDRAEAMRAIREAKEVLDVLHGMSIPIIFYQPSTRTFSSFLAATRFLGAVALPMQDMESFSSVSKGENLADSMRSLVQTTDASAIVLRHPGDTSSKTAAQYSEVPIINAGSGKTEHPTQALLDLHTIWKRLGTIDNLNVVFVGDMKFGRTVKSLATLLDKMGENNTLSFVSAKELALPEEYKQTLNPDNIAVETEDLHSTLATADVVYMTRTQKEWFEQEGLMREYERLNALLRIGRKEAAMMKDDAIIMHPLPRVDELRYGVDDDPKAAYWEQMRNGLYIRMALLEAILVKNPS